MRINYFETKTVLCRENYHGVNVDDPFRWLEQAEDAEVKAWTKQQNELTQAYLSEIGDYTAIKQRLQDLWRFPQVSSAVEKGGRIFFKKNDGSQNQSILYVREIDGNERSLVDPNSLSDDGTIALMNEFYTSDGDLLAYSLAQSGSDWQKIYLMDTLTGEHLDEVLGYTKFPWVAWSKDKSGFFYNRLPDPESVRPEDQNNFRHICWHTIGTPQSEDQVIYRPVEKTLSVSPQATDDGEYLLLWIYRGTDRRNGLYYRAFSRGGEFIELFEVERAMFNFVGNRGDEFYVHTDLDAPNGKVVAISLSNPNPSAWKTIVPEREDAIDEARIVNGNIVVKYFHQAHHQLKIFKLNGDVSGSIPLPTLGSVLPLSGGPDDSRYYFLFSSFLYPDTVLYYDFADNAVHEFADGAGIDFPIEEYETIQKFYLSKDGTQVPIFLTQKKGIQLDGQNPTILYGYGGFNLAQPPFFKVWNLTWLEMGGVFALANLRGGNEFGEEWHQAGMLDQKQNVFDDFHAAAEWLIEEGYTSTPKLAIEGRSNGGLLTAVCMLQRPDLYGAILCHVPVIDMLRYHKFTLGHFWIPEYGDAETNPDHFKFMYAYSPLHNVREEELYPPVLVTTADTDDRVVPLHSKKFVATLQSKADPHAAYLLRVEEHAGHGLGKPVAKLIEERADCWAFLVDQLDMSI